MQATAEWLDTDYYEVLGVQPTASKKEIRTAYRKLARTAHPDSNPDDSTAEQRFSDIAKAYEVLHDDDNRAEYDDVRMRASQPTYTARDPFNDSHHRGDYVDLGDIFGDFFAHQQHAPRRGADISASLSLDFVDAVNGLTTTLVVDERPINVRIPAGVSNQQTIRLATKGHPGSNGAPNGDLLIKIEVLPHHQFGRSGKNLTVTVPVSYEDAVLGGQVSVPTLRGADVTVRLPAGSQSGSKLRVKGQGVATSSGTGDLLATIKVDVPELVSDAERALLEQLRALRATI